MLEQPRIRVTGATFSYNGREIFRDVSLDLAAGDILCLLGPNGCGKTTLLRCVNGIMPLRRGQVCLNGRDMRTLSETTRAQSIGFVFQEHKVLFPYSVLDTVLMGRAPHLSFFAVPSERDREIAEAALATVGIAHLRDKPYTAISGGERQLALIARAVAQCPTILLLDEPTSHLDFGNQVLILETVERLRCERGIAVLMATHFPGHALLVSNRVALMNNGSFSAVGHPTQVITETNLKSLYGVDVRVVAVNSSAGAQTQAVIPVMRKT